jgi:hypothetical protein
MAAVIGPAAAWPWSAVLVPTLWPRILYLLTGAFVMLGFVSYTSEFGAKLQYRPGAVAPPDEATVNEAPPRGIDAALDLASLVYDSNGKITLARVAIAVHAGSVLMAMHLLLPSVP